MGVEGETILLTRYCFSVIRLGTYALRLCLVCVVDVRVCLRSSVGILDEALDLIADLCMALFLHFRHFWQHVWHTPLLSSSAFPAPSLCAPCFVVAGFFGFLMFSLPSCSLPCLHLGVRSLELRLLRECFLVCLRSCLCLFVWQGKSSAH